MEWRKLAPYRTVYVLLSLYVILVAAISVFAKQSMLRLRFGQRLLDNVFDLPGFWGYLMYVSGYFTLFLSVLIISLVCNEWEFRTLRQHVADRLPRWLAVASKSLVAVGLSLFATGLIFTVGALVGIWPEGPRSEMIGHIAPGLGRFWLQTFGYLSLAMLAGFTLRRTGLALAAFVLYVVVGEAVLGWILARWVADVTPYLPAQALANVIETPFARFTGAPRLVSGSAVAIAGAYALAFNVVSYGVVARSDL